MWKGQGWQHKYSWLPDNDETHFAGSISAQVRIEDNDGNVSVEFVFDEVYRRQEVVDFKPLH